MPGSIRHDLAERAHLLDLLELVEEVVEGEAATCAASPRASRPGFCVERLLGPLDEGQDVAHAQDPAGQAVGVEDLEGVGLLAGAQELDRQRR